MTIKVVINGKSTLMFGFAQQYKPQNVRMQPGRVVSASVSASRVRAPLWQLAGFVLSHPEFKSSVTLVNSQLFASCQLRFLECL